jgi:hypothetical protein
MNLQVKSTFIQVSRYTAFFALWLVYTVSQLGLALWIHQLLVAWSFVQAQRVENYWLPRAVDMWSMMILGVIVLITVFLTEAYLQKGMRQQRFWRRLGVVTMIEALVAGVLYGFELFL